MSVTSNKAGRSRRVRRLVAVGVIAVLAVALIVAQDSTVLFPEFTSYRLADQHTIVVVVGVAPCSWSRVTGVTETATEVRVKVETLPCPILGPGTASLALRELTVPVADDVAGRTIADAQGHPIPMRPAIP